MDCLHRGYVFRSKLGLEDYFGEWRACVSTELLFASYTEFAEKQRERHPMSRESMGKFLATMGCRPRRLRNSAVGEHQIEELDAQNHRQRAVEVFVQPRAHGYETGTLEKARAAFTEHTKLSIEWTPAAEDAEEDVVES